jgi:hypothetical protein
MTGHTGISQTSPNYIDIGYPTGLEKVINLFGFKYRKSTGMPLRAKSRANDAA